MNSQTKDMTFAVKCFGCQMNKLDTALVSSALEEKGWVRLESVKQADAVIINTCSVRRHAEERVLSHLGHLMHIKKTRPELVVAVIGCMAQRMGDQLLAHDAVDVVCGPAQIPQLPDLIGHAMLQQSRAIRITEKIREAPRQDDENRLNDFETIHSTAEQNVPAQAFVRIMRGCDNFCTYCIVPYVRGPEICREPHAILDQIKKLAETGTKQITLLGQTVNAYQYRTGAKTWSLADLLAAVAEIAGIEWIRFVTSYPTQEFFDDIINVMADSPKVCNYLHLPAQSGSNRILKAMNRNYTAASYLELIDRARAIVPDIAIAGDFIVGFPGETDADFQDTVELAKMARYKNAFIFKYSPRPGTTSDRRLADTVPPEVKQQRNSELLAVQEGVSEQLSRDFLSQTVQVLVEGPSRKSHINADGQNNPQLVARTATDWIVVFNGPADLAGQFAEVRIVETSPLTLFGRLVQ